MSSIAVGGASFVPEDVLSASFLAEGGDAEAVPRWTAKSSKSVTKMGIEVAKDPEIALER